MTDAISEPPVEPETGEAAGPDESGDASTAPAQGAPSRLSWWAESAAPARRRLDRVDIDCR